MDYLDFVLEILEGQGRDHVVAVQRAPTGATPRVKMRFPFTPRAIEGHTAGVQGLAFSPDGRTLAAMYRNSC